MKKNYKISLIIFIYLFLNSLIIGQNIVELEKTEFISDSENKVEINVIYNIPKELHQIFQKEYFFIEIEDPDKTIKSEKTIYPKTSDFKGQESFFGEITVKKIIYFNKTSGLKNYKLYAHYQMCNEDGLCYLPEKEEFNIKVNLINQSPEKTSFSTIIKYIFLALFGGILLNLMPCIFPLLSIKALSLAKQRNDNPKKIKQEALLYSAGIIFSLMILAGITIGVKSAGEFAGWGFHMQNPTFVIFLITLIYLFSLSLFDFFSISLESKALNKISSYTGAFTTGIFAVLIAAPCTAPLMGPALGFAFSMNALVIILVFLFIGVGFALPFVALSYFPGIIKLFPKPGTWMENFKKTMGFLLVATVIYLLSNLTYQIGPGNVLRIIYFLFFLTITTWISGILFNPIHKKITRISSIIIFILSLLFLGNFFLNNISSKDNFSRTEQKASFGWEIFSPEKINNYTNNNNAVFLEFTAEWCTSCKINDKLVLNTKEISNLFKEKNVKLLYGDFTNNDPVIADWLRKYKRAGVPLYIYFAPGNSKGKILPELLSKNIIRKALNN